MIIFKSSTDLFWFCVVKLNLSCSAFSLILSSIACSSKNQMAGTTLAKQKNTLGQNLQAQNWIDWVGFFFFFDQAFNSSKNHTHIQTRKSFYYRGRIINANVRNSARFDCHYSYWGKTSNFVVAGIEGILLITFCERFSSIAFCDDYITLLSPSVHDIRMGLDYSVGFPSRFVSGHVQVGDGPVC